MLVNYVNWDSADGRYGHLATLQSNKNDVWSLHVEEHNGNYLLDILNAINLPVSPKKQMLKII